MERTFGALCSLLVFITLSCLNFLYFLLILVSFLGDGTPKTFIFIGRVVIFKVFVILSFDVVWGVFWEPLGPS